MLKSEQRRRFDDFIFPCCFWKQVFCKAALMQRPVTSSVVNVCGIGTVCDGLIMNKKISDNDDIV